MEVEEVQKEVEEEEQSDKLFIHLRDNMEAIRKFCRDSRQQIPTPEQILIEGDTPGSETPRTNQIQPVISRDKTKAEKGRGTWLQMNASIFIYLLLHLLRMLLLSPSVCKGGVHVQSSHLHPTRHTFCLKPPAKIPGYTNHLV